MDAAQPPSTRGLGAPRRTQDANMSFSLSHRALTLEKPSKRPHHHTQHKGRGSPGSARPGLKAVTPRAGAPARPAEKAPGHPDRALPSPPVCLRTCSPCLPRRCGWGDPALTSKRRKGLGHHTDVITSVTISGPMTNSGGRKLLCRGAPHTPPLTRETPEPLPRVAVGATPRRGQDRQWDSQAEARPGTLGIKQEEKSQKSRPTHHPEHSKFPLCAREAQLKSKGT